MARPQALTWVRARSADSAPLADYTSGTDCRIEVKTMSRVKFTVAALAVAGAAACLPATAYAAVEISRMSTWQLCKNLQDDSAEAASLREQSARELEKRNADCSFLKSRTRPVAKAKGPPSYERDPFIEQGLDLMNRSQPR